MCEIITHKQFMEAQVAKRLEKAKEQRATEEQQVRAIWGSNYHYYADLTDDAFSS